MTRSRKQPAPTGIPVVAARSLARYLWPTFFSHGGCVLADCSSPDIFRDYRRGKRGARYRSPDRTGFEAFANHLHVLDILKQEGVWNATRNRYRVRHPAFRTAEVLGRVIAHTWFAKLQRDFPRDDFRVYFTRNDNPIVRFHRIYPDENLWLSEEDWQPDVARGWVVALDTRRLQPAAATTRKTSSPHRRRKGVRKTS